MKRVSKRMWFLLTVAALVLSVSGATLAMGNMPMPADPAAPMPAGTPMNMAPAPAAAPVSGPATLATLGLTVDQINALNPLIDQAKKAEKTKQDELAKLQADRAAAAAQAKPDAKKVANLDKLIQIKQGEITVARGQAQIAFAKVVGDAKAKSVADIVFVSSTGTAQQAVNHSQWLDQMNQTMDQMMTRLPELSQKNPDEALKLMNEMLKVMNQMTSMMNNDRRGMMAPATAAPAAAGANSGMQMSSPADPQASGGGMQMGMGMMQQEMNMMQQMMQMMPMMNDNKDPNMSGGSMNNDPMAAPDPNAGGMGGGMMMDGMDKMMGMM